MSERRITLAAIAGAHGIGGEVRLKLFAQSLDSLKRHSAVQVGDREYAISSVRQAGQGAVARLVGIGSRDAAEAMRGQLVTVNRASLPPLPDDEYYHADIIGLACMSATGEALGTVVGIEDYGAGDVLEVERPDGARALVPFRLPAAEWLNGAVVIDPVFLA